MRFSRNKMTYAIAVALSLASTATFGLESICTKLIAQNNARSEHATYTLSSPFLAGIVVGTFEITLTTHGSEYCLTYKTQITSWFHPFNSAGESEGVLAGRLPTPKTYAWSSDKRDDWIVDFSSGEARVTRGQSPVPVERREARDPLTLALIAARSVGPSSPFVGRSFDGKRLLAMRFDCEERQEDGVLPCGFAATVEPGGQWPWFVPGIRPSGVDTWSGQVLLRLNEHGSYWPLILEARRDNGSTFLRIELANER